MHTTSASAAGTSNANTPATPNTMRTMVAIATTRNVDAPTARGLHGWRRRHPSSALVVAAVWREPAPCRFRKTSTINRGTQTTRRCFSHALLCSLCSAETSQALSPALNVGHAGPRPNRTYLVTTPQGTTAFLIERLRRAACGNKPHKRAQQYTHVFEADITCVVTHTREGETNVAGHVWTNRRVSTSRFTRYDARGGAPADHISSHRTTSAGARGERESGERRWTCRRLSGFWHVGGFSWFPPLCLRLSSLCS